MSSHGAWTPIGALRESVSELKDEIDTTSTDLNTKIDRLSERLTKVEARINMAIGGIAVIGLTAIVNTVTNILQSSG